MRLQEQVGIYVVGTAGCGKSTLVAAMGKWFSEAGLSCALLNLDPGALDLPYEPDIDVRDWITLGDVMEEYGLGPNGAQIVCADMLALEIVKVKEAVKDTACPFVIVDTPGQLELFTFREASKEIVLHLFPSRSFMVYLVDPINSRTPSGYISQLMLASLSGLRFQIPMAHTISKMDIVQPMEGERLRRWREYPDALLEDAMAEAQAGQTMNVQLAIGLFRSLEELGLFHGMTPISSTEGTGIDEIYRDIIAVFMGGEDEDVPSGQPDEEGRTGPQD